MTIENREIESMRENGETYGIQDIPHSKQNKIAERVIELFNEATSKHEPEEYDLYKITICGSFAYGDALENISDLDLRLVIDQNLQNHDKVADYMKRNYDTDNDIFGYIDVQCHTSNSTDPEHVTIWTN